jgi:hypothetical protein
MKALQTVAAASNCHSLSYIHNKTDDTTNFVDACNESQLRVIDVSKRD